MIYVFLKAIVVDIKTYFTLLACVSRCVQLIKIMLPQPK